MKFLMIIGLLIAVFGAEPLYLKKGKRSLPGTRLAPRTSVQTPDGKYKLDDLKKIMRDRDPFKRRK